MYLDYVKGCHGHGSGDSMFRHNERNWRIVITHGPGAVKDIASQIRDAFKQIPLKISDFVPTYMLHKLLF